MNRRGWAAAAVLALALAFRVPGLDAKPMHADEAMGADRAVRVLGTRRLSYDPAAYHGPTLSLATVPVLVAARVRSLADTEEWMFRIVPALCGAALALAPWLLLEGAAAVAAGVAVAVSPAFVYWSRHYIQEMLLVLLGACLLGFCRRVADRGWCGTTWVVGACAGVMVATKETAWLMLGAAGVALAFSPGSGRWCARDAVRCLGPAAGAFLIAGWLLGGFGALAGHFRPYAALAIGGGDHAHPWHYYAGVLRYEGVILVLAVAGVWLGRGVPAVRFLSVYTVVLAAAYSAMPYKTPWCLLGFWWGACVLAGAGTAALWKRLEANAMHAALAVVLAAAAARLGWQAWQTSFVDPAGPGNPYSYAQAAGDAVRLGDAVGRLAAAHPDRERMLVAVVAPDPWPLPWYLRKMDRVGYWPKPDADSAKAVRLAPVVITATWFAASASGDHVVQHYGLRPGSVVEVRVGRALWEGAFR